MSTASKILSEQQQEPPVKLGDLFLTYVIGCITYAAPLNLIAAMRAGREPGTGKDGYRYGPSDNEYKEILAGYAQDIPGLVAWAHNNLTVHTVIGLSTRIDVPSVQEMEKQWREANLQVIKKPGV